MKSRLLSHIAFKFAKHPENVANESLCFILNSDGMASKKLLAAINREDLTNSITGFQSELSTDDNGRPDIAGVGVDGKLPLIIEGKFWASLTDNQPTNYLKALDEDGVLIFVCPESRTSRLKDELEDRSKIIFEYVDNAYFKATHNNQTLVIIDWISVLSIIEEYASLNNTALSNDIQQLKALCSQMDSKGFLPLSYSDLNEYHGRLCDQLSSTVDMVKDRLKNRTHCDLSGLQSFTGRQANGFYLRLCGLACRISFSTIDWHSKEPKTPYWLGLQSAEWEPDKTIYNKFKTIPEFKDRVDFDGKYSMIAIPLKRGLDQEQLIDHISKEVDKVAEVLNKHKHDINETIS